MIKQMLTIAMAILFSLTVQAKGSSYVNEGDASTPYNADMIFKIQNISITYRADGYMMVCLDKKKRTVEWCYDVNNIPAKDQLTLEEFWKWYFPSAPTLRVVAMDYRMYGSTYIFWLKR
jgi:hypothetical protein